MKIIILALLLGAAVICSGCDSRETDEQSKPTTVSQTEAAPEPSVTAPESVKRLIAKEEHLNDKCRGGSPSAAQIEKDCAQRDAMDEQLRKAGWCYGTEDQYEYQKQWQPCAKPDHETSSAPAPVTESPDVGNSQQAKNDTQKAHDPEDSYTPLQPAANIEPTRPDSINALLHPASTLATKDAQDIIAHMQLLAKKFADAPANVKTEADEESYVEFKELVTGGWCIDSKGLAGPPEGWLPCSSTKNEHILLENALFRIPPPKERTPEQESEFKWLVWRIGNENLSKSNHP